MSDVYGLLDGQMTMFVTQLPQLPLTFNQYVLATEAPLLVHTGAIAGAEVLAGQVRSLLGGGGPAYIFVSHFESDECGGIGVLLDAFPSAVAVCSEVTARQLAGFGITDRTLVRTPDETLDLGNGELSFVEYPSEMHLWPGLLAFEKGRSILFSSDLIMRFGPVEEPIVESDWRSEVDAIAAEKIPDIGALDKMKAALGQLPVQLVATGHGPALDVFRG